MQVHKISPTGFMLAFKWDVLLHRGHWYSFRRNVLNAKLEMHADEQRMCASSDRHAGTQSIDMNYMLRDDKMRRKLFDGDIFIKGEISTV